MRLIPMALLVVLLLAGCQASRAPAVDTAAPDAGADAMTLGSACREASGARIRRLSQREYLNVVEDLLGAQARQRAASLLPAEPKIAGFDNQDDGLRVGSLMHGVFGYVAETLSLQAEVDDVCLPDEGRDTCVDRFARAFTRRAFGREASQTEQEKLTALASLAEDTPTALRLVIEFVLQAPGTLYSTELGQDSQSIASLTLTDAELANQISLLTTAARPDDQLMAVANLGLLALPEHRQAQVERLLQTPRGRDQAKRFVLGWIDMEDVATAPKNSDVFSAYSLDVARAMQRELDAFVDAHTAGPASTLSALFTDTSQHPPAALSVVYDDELAMTGQQTVLSPRFRRGILSLPAWLTYHAADQHSGPIGRGLVIRRQLLCQDVPSPPTNLAAEVSSQAIDISDKAKTTRQKYEQHRSDRRCVGCHTAFDAIGFGLEDMDGMGRHRTTENDLAVDATGELLDTDVDGPFNGVAELCDKLARSQVVSDCFVQQFFRFAAGRPPTDADDCVILRLQRAFDQHGRRLDSLFSAFVSDPTFAMRVAQ